MNKDHRNSPQHADMAYNPSTPQKPTSNSRSVATFEDLRNQIGNLSNADLTAAAVSLLEKEYDGVEEYLNQGEYFAAAVRLNALFETYTEVGLQAEWEGELNRPLSEIEREFLEHLGHAERLERAGSNSIITGHFKGALKALYKKRNYPAHEAWIDLNSSDMKSDVEHAHSKLKEHIEHLRKEHLI